MSFPSALFVPVSGPGGSGEYYRCLALARALADRRPDITIHFLVRAGVALEGDERFHYHELEASPTRDTAGVVAVLDAVRPGLVLFDSAGRVAQFRRARRLGARVVWLSDRPNKRRKGFRWRMLGHLDLHLMGAPGRLDPALSRLERFKLRFFPRLATRFFSGIAPPPDGGRQRILHRALGLEDKGYVIFAPGGGGYFQRGRPVPEILLEAAARVRTATGLECVMVMGPQYRGGVREHESVRVVSDLPTVDLTQLLHGARLAVIGAGSMMTAQTLSIGTPAVMVPAGGDDQPSRIADFSRRGLVTASPLTADDITHAAAGLANDPERRQKQVEAVRRAGIRNDVGEVAEVLYELLDREG